MTLNNSKLYGWTQHVNGLITRIPASSGLDKLLYQDRNTGLKYLAIPEQFKDYRQIQYLIKESILKVRILSRTLKEIQPGTDYWTRESETGTQHEILLELWKEEIFDISKFPQLYFDWKRLRPKDAIKNYKIQQTLWPV